MSNINIESDLLLYSLNISNWTARKRDDKATAQVKEANGVKAETDAGNFNKLLLPDFKELDAVNKFVGQVRANWFYLKTAPWGEQRGIRVGKAEFHMDRLTEFGDLQTKFQPLVQAAVDAYMGQVSKAEMELQKMFDISEYPSEEEFADRFSMRLSAMPMNNPKDIRVMSSIPEHIRVEMEETMRAEINNAMESTVKEALTQLYTPLAHMAVTLKGYHDGKIKKLYDSVVENVIKMADAARMMNITNNPDIEALAVEAEAFARSVTTKDLKDSEGLQRTTGKKAQELANRIAQFLP